VQSVESSYLQSLEQFAGPLRRHGRNGGRNSGLDAFRKKLPDQREASPLYPECQGWGLPPSRADPRVGPSVVEVRKACGGSGAGVSPAVARASCPRTFAPRLRSPWTSIADVRLSFRHAGARRSRHSGRDARATRPDLAILCFLPLALALLLLPSCSKKSPEGEGEGTEEGASEHRSGSNCHAPGALRH